MTVNDYYSILVKDKYLIFCLSSTSRLLGQSGDGSGVSNVFTAPFTYPQFFSTDTQTYLADLDNMTKCFLVVGVE